MGGGGVRVDVKELGEELKSFFFWGGGGGSIGGQGRCEQRSEVFVKIPKKKIVGGRFGGGGGAGRGGGLGKCNKEVKFF